MDYILSLSLSDLGSWASLIGLVVTFVTATVLFRIKKKLLFRSSIDNHLAEMVRISSSVTASLQCYSDNQKEIDELFALADVELRAMQRGTSEDLLSDIKAARKLIRKYRSRIIFYARKNEASAREIKTSLSVVSAELGHHRKSLLVGV